MLTRERLLEVLPEINEVETPQWREACVAIWLEAAGDSSWEDIMDAPNNPDLPPDPLVRHTRGVLRGAFALARAMEESQQAQVDHDKLRVICLVHDVCKLVELERDGEGFRKSRIGEEFPHGYLSGYYCMKHGLPRDITAAVTSHSQFVKNVPGCIEGILQFYADLADADVRKHLTGYPLLIGYCKL